ncbi:hypothetical protein BD779DRAFT_1610504 [Infundibulicybe gibba]|nr:hypothetical protein BD779DRAFT_1610504 [Infundibulicybe gibba]
MSMHGPTSVPHISDVARKSSSAGNVARARYQTVPPPATSQTPIAKGDLFYGNEPLARLCTRFISHLFTCPENPPVPTTNGQAKLPLFIAYALHRTKLHASVTFASLILLQRLKARFPTARGSSGHRLFISAFMIASKVMCDDTYSNKSWSIVAQGMFALREINQMEREMCNYLDWELSVDSGTLEDFERALRKDFATNGPYPNYPVQMVSKRAVKAALSTSATPIPEPSSTTSPIPSFGQRHPTPSKPIPASTTPQNTIPQLFDLDLSGFFHITPHPPGIEDFSARIRDSEEHLTFSITNACCPSDLKSKMFAQAKPSAW